MTNRENGVVEGFRRIKSSMHYLERRRGVLGRLDDAGELDLDVTADLPATYNWIRYGDSRTVAVVKNLRTEYAAGMHVIAGLNADTDEYEVIGVDPLAAPDQYGAAAAGLNSPRKTAATPTPTLMRDIIDGGVFADSDSGGLYIRIPPYHHRGGYWIGTPALALTPTSTSGMHSWVAVGINTLTNTITQALTTDHPIGNTLPESDITPIIIANPDVDWRGAVDIENGATSINSAGIVNLRGMGETRPKMNYSASGAPTTGDDADDGYGVGSLWLNVSADTVYFCLDNTVGAAVWKQMGDGAITGDADIIALAALSSTGVVARTGSGTYSPRTITGGTGIGVTNGDGVSGNPTVTLANTAVTPGSYTNADITVDAQGRITTVANGASGGDLSATAYTPNELTDWTGSTDPGSGADAVDQLAARVTILEGATGTAFAYLEASNIETVGPDEAVTDVEVETDEVIYNEGGIWDAGDPELFTIPYNGIYTIKCLYYVAAGTGYASTGVISLQDNTTADRVAIIADLAADTTRYNQSFSLSIYLDAAQTLKFIITNLDAGGNLSFTIEALSIFLERQVTL